MTIFTITKHSEEYRVRNQKDRGLGEISLLKRQAASGKDRRTLIAEQIARRHTKIGGQKLADAIESFGLNFDGLQGGPVVKKNPANVLRNKLVQSRPGVNEG